MTGPLSGFRVLELAGIGPGPCCGMMLADMGAEVIRISRPGGDPIYERGHDVLFRNRRHVAINLRHPEGVAAVLKLCETADAIFEGFRPGVVERMGVGPEACMVRNPKLVYGRMTGWGQTGPLAKVAGHDINYIALSGALHAIGHHGGKPVVPLNLVGDFGGGGVMLAFGIVCALLEAQRSGQGQVIDCAMHEGSAALMAMFYAMRAHGEFSDERGTNLLDSGAPFYDVYETADGRYVSIGSIEPQFFAVLKEKAGLGESFGAQMDKSRWPEQKAMLEEVFRSKTRDEWCAIFEGTEACFAPVLSLAEAPQHPHNVARGSFIEVGGIVQAAPTPRFSRTPAGTPEAVRKPGTDTRATLLDSGFSESEVDELIRSGAAVQV